MELVGDGEVVLALKPSQVEILHHGVEPQDRKTDRKILLLLERRTRATNALLKDLGKQLSVLRREFGKRRWFRR